MSFKPPTCLSRLMLVSKISLLFPRVAGHFGLIMAILLNYNPLIKASSNHGPIWSTILKSTKSKNSNCSLVLINQMLNFSNDLATNFQSIPLIICSTYKANYLMFHRLIPQSNIVNSLMSISYELQNQRQDSIHLIVSNASYT